MKLSRLIPLLFAGGVLAIGQARATEMLYFDLSGTFGATAPTTALSAPNSTFDLQFTLPANFASSPGYYYFTEFLPSENYVLENNPPVTSTSSDAPNPYLQPSFTAFNPSLFNNENVEFTLPFEQNEVGFFFFSGAQIYSGSESDPTINAGTYILSDYYSSLDSYNNGVSSFIGSAAFSNAKLVISDSPIVNSVPDGGSTFALMGIGCLGLCMAGKLGGSRMAQAS